MTQAKAPPSASPPSALPASASNRHVLSGALAPAIARFGVPLAVGMGFQTTFNLVDAYIISRIGSERADAALGALGACDQLSAVGSAVSYGLSIATAAILCRRHAVGDLAGTRRVAWQSVLLVGALGLFFALVGVFGAGFLIEDVLGAKGEVAAVAKGYLRVAIGGSFTMFFLLHLVTLQRAVGASKVPVAFLILSNVLNFFLGVLLVYGPGEAPPVFSWGPPIASALHLPRLELLGAAWATVLARLIVLVPLAATSVTRLGLFRRSACSRPDGALLRAIVAIGWPSSAQIVVRIVAMLVTLQFVNRAFTTATNQDATTALGVVFRLETMILFVSLGWGGAAQTFVGQNLGAGQLARAKASGWYTALYNTAFMVVLALTYREFAAPIVAFFAPGPEIVATGSSYLAWVTPSYLFLGLGVVLGSAMQGAGATRRVLGLDLSVLCLVQVPLSTLVVLLGLPEDALWAVVALTNLAFALTYVLQYRLGHFLAFRL